MRLASSAVLAGVLASCLAAHTQQPPSLSPTEFHAAVIKLQRQQIPEYRAALEAIKIEDLPVGYNEGKIVERERDQALQWADLTDVLATKIIRSDSLAEEIHLSYLLNELMHSLSDTAGHIAQIEIQKTSPVYARRNAWVNTLQDLAGGPVNSLALGTLDYTMVRAKKLQDRP